MKDFSVFNQWIREHAFSNLTAVISRAVSRVTALKNDINRVQSEYVSAYNSVQTLGYDSDGQIEDQTSSDRLTVPEGVLCKARATLLQQRNSLVTDRAQFINEMCLPGLQPGGLYYSINSAIMPNSRNVVSLGGVVQLIITREGDAVSAEAVMPAYIINELNDNSIEYVRIRNVPNAIYRNSSADTKAAVWTDADTFPDPNFMGSTSIKQWRVILFQDNLRVNRLIVSFHDGQNFYCFYFQSSTLQNDVLLFSSTVIETSLVNSDSDLERIFQLAGTTYSEKGLVYYNSNTHSCEFVSSTTFDQSQQSIWYRIFAYEYWRIVEVVMYTPTLKSIYSNIFDAIMTITPENLSDLADIVYPV